jgi:hypothetical protein
MFLNIHSFYTLMREEKCTFHTSFFLAKRSQAFIFFFHVRFTHLRRNQKMSFFYKEIRSFSGKTNKSIEKFEKHSYIH